MALVLILSCASSVHSASNRKVNVALKSKWSAYPLASEASEFFESVGSEHFWGFLEYLEDVGASSDKEVFDKAVDFANSIKLSRALLSLLKWSLSIHNENPKLEAHRHLASQELLPFELQNVTDGRAWVHINGKVFGDVNEVQAALSLDLSNAESPELYPFDHKHPSSFDGPSPVVILYGSIGDQKTLQFHRKIIEFVGPKQLRYVFRHWFSKEHLNLPKLNLQGFGVDLALKSLEYKVIDDSKQANDKGKEDVHTDSGPVQGFDFTALTKQYPHLSSELLAFKAHLLAADFQMEQLKVWELKDLGLISTQKILEAPEPLRMLRDISQNLPVLAHTLARQAINDTARSSILSIISRLNGFSNGLWINKVAYSTAALDPFMLYRSISQQIFNTDLLKNIGISSSSVYDILSHSFPESSGPQLDLSSIQKNIIFVNNLDTDGRYYNWYPRVEDILQPVWPQQFHYVRKNFWTVVLVVDPADKTAASTAFQLLNLMWQNLPARIGFLFDMREKRSERAGKVWKYVYDNWGVTTLYQFLRHLTSSSGSKLGDDELRAALIACMGDYFEDSMTERKEVQTFIQGAKKSLIEKGISGLGTTMFVNGHMISVPSPEALVDPLISKIFELREQMQGWVRNGLVTDSTDIFTFVSKQPGSLSRFNALVFPSSEKPKYLPIHQYELLDTLSYFNSRNADDLIHPVTHLVAMQLNTSDGRGVVKEAFSLLEKGDFKMTRFGIVDCSGSITYRAFHSIAQSGATASDYLPLLSQILDAKNIDEKKILELVEGSTLSTTKFQERWNDVETWNKLQEQTEKFCREHIGQDNAVITAGRIIRIPEEVTWLRFDFETLSTYEHNNRLSTIHNLVQDISYSRDPDSITSAFVSNIIQKVAAIISLIPEGVNFQQQMPQIEPSFKVKSGTGEDISVLAVLDPLSKNTQKITPILMGLLELFDCTISVIMSPARSLSDMPLKNFYRYQMDVLSFDENGKAIENGIASFSNLPQGRLLSTTIQVPSSWLVLSSKCKYDLDNIVLDKLPTDELSMDAEFVLENILIEGSCMDLSNRGIPPRGLELVLSDKINPHIQDSLVMSNLGYFQLKANPGVFELTLAPGRASTIYTIKETAQSEESIPNKKIIMTTWSGEQQMLYVEKRKGMEDVSLFKDSPKKKDEGGNSWSLSNLFGGKEEGEVGGAQKKDDTIHVFSLASGHLYERFLKIMMLTVIKNTDANVKFWLLSNFLSPAFKEFVPKMAERYGFQVELVTYKWPAWLHEQTEKQRIIWAYKILFLDVLFPLNISRIIYVDADQIVRADLRELRDMDLQGAPYGYTPFCSGYNMNPDTTGFRFWDSGYWRDHLGGKPYHISALYVIDLPTLRENGFADSLRATYNGLSKDPNSLANLDQDLPNYLQGAVPIFSLPQEWLWCETWCTMNSKENAKTIDLCNNPLTKIPKLEAAMRLIPEWVDLDTEVKQVEATTIPNSQDDQPTPTPANPEDKKPDL
uniref:UDP-glucose:glycoprotein glucosyltransferase n=1 Tax=Arcella intermedia TaxID=1963864 RepID=A0A6B2KWC8_9EUKA